VNPKALAAVVAALIVGLLGRLLLRVSPRVGVRLVRWSAGLRYPGDPARAAVRAEELAALVDDRPGRLLKLLTGMGFALHALAVAGLRAEPGRLRRLGRGAVRFARRHRVSLVAWLVAVVWQLVVASGGTVAVLMLRARGYTLDGFWVGVGLGAGMLIVAMAGTLGLARAMGGREAVAEVSDLIVATSWIYLGWPVWDLFGIWAGLAVTGLISVASMTLSDWVKRQEPARTGPGATAKIVARARGSAGSGGGVGHTAQPRQSRLKPRRPGPTGGQMQDQAAGGAGEAAGQGQQGAAQGLGQHQLPAHSQPDQGDPA
jgi:hypothetical protein